jgi:hypothetical protein
MPQVRYDVHALIRHKCFTPYTEAEMAQRAEAREPVRYGYDVVSEEHVYLTGASMSSRSTSGIDHGHGYTVHVYTATTDDGTILEVGTTSYVDFAKDGQMLIRGYGIKEDREDFESWQCWAVKPASS